MQKNIIEEESVNMCRKKLIIKENSSLSSHGLNPRGFSRSLLDKIYGCIKFRDSNNVVALDLEKEDDCNKEDNSTQYYVDKDKNDIINKSHDAFKADNFNFTVDDVEILSSYCTEVFVSDQKGKIIVKAKFYFNKATRNVSTSSAFNIGSEHKLYISVFNDELNEHEELLSLATCILTKKSYCLNKKEVDDPLEFELTFEDK